MLSSRARDVGNKKSAITFVNITQCFGWNAVVYRVQGDACTVIKRRIREKGENPQGSSIFEKRINDTLGIGVTYQFCQQVAKTRNTTREDMIEATRIVCGFHMIAYARV